MSLDQGGVLISETQEEGVYQSTPPFFKQIGALLAQGEQTKLTRPGNGLGAAADI
jgi:hypothetical protein